MRQSPEVEPSAYAATASAGTPCTGFFNKPSDEFVTANSPCSSIAAVSYARAASSLVGKEEDAPIQRSQMIGKADYQARGVLYLPGKSRFSYLLNLPEGTNIGKAINEAMKAKARMKA